VSEFGFQMDSLFIHIILNANFLHIVYIYSLFLRHVSALVIGLLQSARTFLDMCSMCAYLLVFVRSDDEYYKIITEICRNSN